MIVSYSGKTIEEQLKSLKDNINLALNTVEASGLQSGAKVGTLIVGHSGELKGLLDGDTIALKNLNASEIKTGTIDANQIAVVNLDANNIKTGTIDAEMIDVVNMNADNITSGTINAGVINVSNINGHNIIEGSIVADALADGVITLFTNTNVFYNSEDPRTTEPPHEVKDGDMWYKTVATVGHEDEAEYVYVFSESEDGWVQKTLDAKMLTAGTVTAREIAAGAITTEKITTEDIEGEEGRINLRSGTFNYGDNTAGLSWDGSVLIVRGTIYAGEESNIYTMEQVNDIQVSLADQTSTLENAIATSEMTLSDLAKEYQLTKTDVSGLLDHLNLINKFVVVSSDGYILLGASDDETRTPLRIRIDGTAIGFYDGEIDEVDLSNNRVAWLINSSDEGDSTLHIENAEIENAQRIGDFVWQKRGQDRLTLMYSPVQRG